MKVCSICKENKSLDEFYSYVKESKIKGQYIYFPPYCKECTISKSRKRHLDNHDKYKAKMKEYNQKIQEDPEGREAHRVRGKEQRERGYFKMYYQKNKEKFKNYRYEHLHKKHDINDEEWQSCRDYFNNSCAYCNISENAAKSNYGHNLHMEHAMNNGANDLSNCIPACRKCNSQKWINDYQEWYTEENPIFTFERFNKIIKWLGEDHKKYLNKKEGNNPLRQLV